MEDRTQQIWRKHLKITKELVQQSTALQKIKRMMDHQRNKHITRHPGTGALKMVNKKRHPFSQSLHKRLQCTFYPYTMGDPIAASTLNKFLNIPSREKEDTHQLKSDCKTYGKWHGEIVHKQLENFAHIVRENLTKLSQVDVYKTFVQSCGKDGPDPCSFRIVNALVTQGVLPVHAEVPIWDEVIGVLSAIDLVCVSLEEGGGLKEAILVEIKTGYSSEAYKETEKDLQTSCHYFLRDPLRRIVNCPFHRASLQLLICGMILQKRYNVTFDRAFIVRICPKTKLVYMDSLPKWALQNSTAIYEAMRIK